MSPAIGLVVSLISMFLCIVIADSKGRSVVAWGIIGFVFGLIGLLIIFFIEPVPEPKVIVKEKTVVREMTPVKNIETKEFYNNIWSASHTFAVTGIRFYDDELLSVKLTVRNYDQPIKYIKADMVVADTFGDDCEISQMVFDLTEMDSNGWQQSDKVTIQASHSLAFGHIKKVSVKPVSIIPEAGEKLDVSSEWRTADDEAVDELKRVYGKDAFVAFEELGDHYRCVCGNNVVGDLCERCSRLKERLLQGDGTGGFIEELKGCSSYKQAKEVHESYSSILREDVSEAFLKRLGKDIQIKRMYGGSDFKDKLEMYLRIIEQVEVS